MIYLALVGILLWPGFSSELDFNFTRLRCPDEAIQLLHDHYDVYKHEVSGHVLILLVCIQSGVTTLSFKVGWCPAPEGLPHDILAHDYYVPGSFSRKEADRYKGKPIYAEILTTTNDTLILYFQRVVKDIGISNV